MNISKKIFMAIMIFAVTSGANVQAADLNFNADEINLQDLKSGVVQPYLPDRIRHRNDSHKLQKPAPKKIELPPKKEQPPVPYTQRQPKNPPKLTTPSRPTPTADRRGTEPRKSFGPPRFR